MVKAYDKALIQGQIDALIAEGKAINSLAQEESRDLTAEESKRFQAILDEVGSPASGDSDPTGLHADLRTAERFEALCASAAGGQPGRTVDPQASSIVPPETGRPRIAARVPRVKNFRGTVNGVDATERAYRFGHWCLAAIHQGTGLNFPESHAYVSGEISNALSTTNDGQFLVPNEFGTDLIRLVETYGVARRLLTNLTMTSDTRSDPRRTGGLTASFKAENAAGSGSDVGLDNVTLVAKTLQTLSVISNELDADSAIAIGDLLLREIAQAFAQKEDQCAFLGDGTSTYGGIQGVNSKLGALTAGTAPGLILGAGNTFAELTLANHEAIVGALPQYADTEDATWVCHRTYYYTVMLRLLLASGGATATEAADGDRRPRPMFLGYPVTFSQVMPSSDANSQVPVTLGDFSQAARFGDRQMESIAFSDSATVDGVNVFAANQLAVRGTERFDINVHDVGSNSVAGPVVGLETASS